MSRFVETYHNICRACKKYSGYCDNSACNLALRLQDGYIVLGKETYCVDCFRANPAQLFEFAKKLILERLNRIHHPSMRVENIATITEIHNETIPNIPNIPNIPKINSSY